MMKLKEVIAVLGCGSRPIAIALIALLALALSAPEDTTATQAGRSAAPGVSTAANANIIRYAPNLKVSSLAGRADTDLVEFANGRRMRVGELRRLESWGQKARNARRQQFPAALRTVPAATGKRVDNAAELSAALQLPDNETVVLPSGRRATVGMIKFVQPQVEKKLGRRLASAPQRPGLTGPAINVSRGTTQDEWKMILQKPDSTVVESPNGMRIAVGELKQELRAAPARQRKQGR